MKTIVVPTDFSGIARNAVNFAVELASKSKAKIVLLHACSLPVMVAEVPVEIPDMGDLEKEGLKKLKKLRYALQSKFGSHLQMELVCKTGMANDVILDYTAEHPTDLIVMGMHGLGYLEEKLIGNVTTSLIKKSKVPVLSVDRRVRFRALKKIVLATDYKEVGNQHTLDILKKLAGLFQSHVHVLNVVKSSRELPTTQQAVAGVKLNHLLSSVEHSFHTEVNPSVVAGIQQFAAARRMDLIVMIPRKRTFFQSLLKIRNTKEVAFHIKTPLLTLHE